MPRRTRVVTIEKPPADAKENRDAGKSFLVTEVDAIKAEEWGLRAMMALGTGGIVVPPELTGAGLLGIVLVGYQAFMGAREEAVLPLWREMLPACVAIQHSENVTEPFRPGLVEEVSTLLLLRQTVLEIHTGFTLAELASNFARMNSALSITPTDSSTTQSGQSPAA